MDLDTITSFIEKIITKPKALFKSSNIGFKPGKKFLYLMVLLLIVLIVISWSNGLFLRKGWDGYTYIKTIKKVGDFDGTDLGRYANPFYVTLGYLYKHINLDPFNSILFLALFNACFFIYSSYLFFSLHFKRDTLPYIIFAMLFLWGRIYWAGAYSIVDSYAFFYPQGIAYSFFLLSLYFLHRIIKENKSPWLFIVSLFFLSLSHVATSIFFICIATIYVLVLWHKITLKTVMKLIASSLITGLLLSLWPFYNFLNNFTSLTSSVTTHTSSLASVKHLMLLIIPIVFILFLIKKGRYALWTLLILLPLFKVVDLIEFFAFGLIGLLGLIFLVEEKKWFLPLWWCLGAFQFFLGYYDPTRIILISAFPLHAGAGLLLHKILHKNPKVWIWLSLIILLLLGDIYTVLNWGYKINFLLIIIPLAVISVLILFTKLKNIKNARKIFLISIFILLLIPLMLKFIEIREYPVIEPIPEIKELIPQDKTLLVMEKDNRGIYQEIPAWFGINTAYIYKRYPYMSLSRLCSKFKTPYLLYYQMRPKSINKNYEVLFEDEEMILIKTDWKDNKKKINYLSFQGISPAFIKKHFEPMEESNEFIFTKWKI